MSALLKPAYFSEDDYLTMEATSAFKHEYLNGQIYAMAGATGEHDTIAGNLYIAFGIHLKGKPCRPFSSDIRVRVDRGFFYPDVLIDCGYDSHQAMFAGEPILIVEVLSNSTRRFDLGEKFNYYQKISSLQEYVVVEQDIMRVDIYRRDSAKQRGTKNWSATRYQKGDIVEFTSIGLNLPIEDIYDRIEFVDSIVDLPIKMAKLK